jgi:hypothetical protein
MVFSIRSVLPGLLGDVLILMASLLMGIGNLLVA